jgi:CubicO group peptidase (beta-lactamase class C family)
MDSAVTENKEFAIDRLKQIDNHIQGYVDSSKLAGAVSLIARDNEVVHESVIGLRDLAIESPMNIGTIFRIYSMTKPITSLALMMLVEQDLVQLTDPITRFLPEFERAQVLEKDGKLTTVKQPGTILDLLRHTAGFSYGRYRDSKEPVDKLYDQADLFNLELSLDEMIWRLAKLPLIYQPGEVWHYSIATDVIGHLIEVISGSSLAKFFDHHIFQPLGMTDTAFTVPPEKMERFATLYGRSRATGLKPLDESIGGNYVNPRLLLGGQGLVSTANDFLQFASLILNKGEWQGSRLVERETVELMTRNHLTPDQLPLSYNGIVESPIPGIGFGLGFNVVLDPVQAGIRGSSGDCGWGGYAETYFWIDPKERVIAILMAQFMPSLTYPIRNEFRTLVYQALEG